ncbi:Fis family transcriptional regulator [Lysobacter arseniciresistens ZS79]|uniref:Fis family transcriptional regulator n=1 Tax=Lysobacter arseniciresistens ZS79 TaxID=913325 RepID=A0A0A0F4T6_9GAMM|nr:sigma-54 dependent transcriptional regulator [Lysobacter arseniciresistens]KGM57358.1 Fis family transcriptional regulator [Lysobacter arseniciresistens ZS79]
MSESRILVVERDMDRAEHVATLLEFMDFNPRIVTEASDIDLSRARGSDWVAVVVGDTGGGDDWLGFVDWLSGQPLHPPLLVLPGHPPDAAWRERLHPETQWPLDYPLRRVQLQEALRRASLKRIDEDERREQNAGGGPTGRSPAVLELSRMIDQVAPFDTTVLILGESGTGKEVAARAVHQRSRRANKPFVAINCGAIPPDLLESELFGHEKGAFTGALTQRKGRFEMAEGGTLLLDEIGDMPMPMQVKLLRVLQERSFERVGGTQLIHCDVRVVAATHRNLEAHIHEGKFREDLFYRLNVFPIEMPPLRERVADLPDLIAAITRQLAESGRGRVSLGSGAVAALAHYDWPGNVRELSNLLERLAVLHPSGMVKASDLPARYRAAMPETIEDDLPAGLPAAANDAAPPHPASYSPTTTLPAEGLDLRSHIAEIELELIRAALQQADGVVAHAAPLLGLRRTTLVEKLRKYGIERD